MVHIMNLGMVHAPHSTRIFVGINVQTLFGIEITGLVCLLAIGSWWAGSPLATRCLLLSYKIGPDAYDKGNDDIYFIGFWVVAFTFLRAFFIKYIFHPFARLTGIEPFGKRQRFAEQGFMFTYYAVFWIWGMVSMDDDGSGE